MTATRNGPRTITTRQQTCLGCQWLSRNMVCSGRNPRYRSACLNDTLPVAELRADASGRRGRLIESSAHAPTTPGWCPVTGRA